MDCLRRSPQCTRHEVDRLGSTFCRASGLRKTLAECVKVEQKWQYKLTDWKGAVANVRRVCLRSFKQKRQTMKDLAFQSVEPDAALLYVFEL